MAETKPGLYWWVRDTDETGMSGVGRVAQVAVFEDGTAVLRWLKSRNSAGVGSTVLYDTVRDLVHVHGHGERRTGHLEAAFAVGDHVYVHSWEGFGGVARVIEEREGKGDAHYKVKICDARDVEHSYQPEFWAWNHEVFRAR